MTQESIRPLVVLVPRERHQAQVGLVSTEERSRTWILRGSAIVADLAQWQDFSRGATHSPVLYYEGAAYTSMTYREKLQRAASRLEYYYPTSAQCTAGAPDEYEAVGLLSTRPWSLSIDNHDALLAWGIDMESQQQACRPLQRPMSSRDVAKLLRNPAAMMRLLSGTAPTPPEEPRP